MAFKWSPVLISTALAFVVHVGAANQAFAQDGTEGHHGKYGFKAHDANGDGVISKEE